MTSSDPVVPGLTGDPGTSASRDPEPARHEPMSTGPILAVLTTAHGALVVMDVDLTVANGVRTEGEPNFGDRPHLLEFRPGADTTIRGLVRAGHRVGFWSANGAAHAQNVATAMGVQPILAGCWAKPSTVPSVQSTLRALGELPAVTVDDDPREAVPGVPFVLVEPFLGSRLTAIELSNYHSAPLYRRAQS